MAWQEILGYVASVVVAVSLMMNSIVKLRWINLIGSSLFSAYGFIIGAIPVGVLNGFIALINVYYLIKMYRTTEYFKILPVSEFNEYLNEYLQFYKADIKRFFPDFEYDAQKHTFSYYILRNMALAGVVLGKKKDEQTLIIELDFVKPEFRDLKPGMFLFQQNKQLFKEKGFTRLISKHNSKAHENYLKKVGFKEKVEGAEKYFELVLD